VQIFWIGTRLPSLTRGARQRRPDATKKSPTTVRETHAGL